MACSGKRRSGQRKLGHGATGRPGPAQHWRRRSRRTRTSKNLIGTSCTSAYARAWQRAQSSACSLRIARPLLLIGGVPKDRSPEAEGSFLMAPGQVFASLAVAVVDAHRRATIRRRAQAWVRLRELVRKAASRFLTAPCEDFASIAVAQMRATVRRHLRRAQAWVRLRELVRKAASRRFAWFGSALWLQAFGSRRRREAGDEPAMTVRLTHPEAMGREWGVRARSGPMPSAFWPVAN
jgi:hypothetical protein